MSAAADRTPAPGGEPSPGDRTPASGRRPAPGAQPAARQASLRRLRQFGIQPNRELGQNFLIDDNILDVIGRAAQLEPSDVVLEVGGGLGVLSEYLAPRVRHLHVVEVDATLVPALEDALGPFANATLHVANAARMDVRALSPSPTKVVANLPYGVAGTVIVKTVMELPGAWLWVAMVQREVAERLAAPHGSRAYGAPSALLQMCCAVKVLRPISANVFHPVPRVESALLTLRRREPPPPPELAVLVSAAFAHRRKALSSSLAIAPGAPPGIRERTRAALRQIGLPEDARAERLSPAAFRALADRLGEEALSALLRGRGGAR